ncbi:MAG: hypothetical protein A3J51_06395 [Omnitrophica WOR_2 bacterium RIFCSPHIGHO2_02_FULL_45_21]|nr:MAG: hypothetical protein A3J51_06395 [Omnitrophica WOR_2 bacterium RIFCSPHIGHO2_02_FULL_45_21]
MNNKKIDDIDFVLFDVETTGLQALGGDRIIEIAALHYKNGKTYDSFSSLINPRREISAAAYEVNHISQEMVDAAPPAQEVLPKFLEFIKGGCLAGYNVGFDLGFLENELMLLGKGLPADTAIVDVIRMARSLLPTADRYGLSAVSRYLGINIPQGLHRALSDVELTKDVFSRLISKLKTRGIDNFLQFYNLFGINLKLTEDINEQRLYSIQRAIDSEVRLNIRYYSSSTGEVTERQVTPGEIRQEGKFKYLVGYCHLRKDERTFKINAILNLEIV